MSADLRCPLCGQRVLDPDDFDPAGGDRYDDTPGGHADRHTLVVEAAERAAGIDPWWWRVGA